MPFRFSFSVDDQLVQNVADFIAPPVTANSTAAMQILQILIERPVIMKKVQNEIDNIVGQGRLPTLDDRINMPYTEATIREAMRYHTLLPSGIVHTCMDNTEFMGFDIPKVCDN